MNKEGSFKGIFFVMILSLVIAFFWESASFIKSSAHAILNPTAGALLNWDLTIGMILIVLVISLFMTLIQKYTTDQKTLKEMKKEQKALQVEMKQYRNHPEKMMEMQKKQMEFMPRIMKLSMRPIMFTGIPLILFFRWFMDYFAIIEEATGAPVRFFGFLSWFWFYLIGSIIFSSILRKYLKVA